MVLSLVFIIIVRSESPKAAADINNEYLKGNHELQIYHFGYNYYVRTSADFLRKAKNIGGALTQGDLFYRTGKGVGRRQAITNVNFPRNNIYYYDFERIQIFNNEGHVERFVLRTFREYLVPKRQQPSNDNLLHRRSGIYIRSSSLLEYQRHVLRENGCNFEDNCKAGEIGFTKERGLYPTVVNRHVNVYNRHGERITSLDKGARVFVSDNLPWAVGHERPDLFRIVAFNRSWLLKGVKQTGTMFIDGYKDKRFTIEAIN